MKTVVRTQNIHEFIKNKHKSALKCLILNDKFNAKFLSNLLAHFKYISLVLFWQ